MSLRYTPRDIRQILGVRLDVVLDVGRLPVAVVEERVVRFDDDLAKTYDLWIFLAVQHGRDAPGNRESRSFVALDANAWVLVSMRACHEGASEALGCDVVVTHFSLTSLASARAGTGWPPSQHREGLRDTRRAARATSPAGGTS